VTKLWTPEGSRNEDGLYLPPVAGGADFPEHMAFLATRNVISTMGLHSWTGLNGSVAQTGSFNGTANRAYFVPVRIVLPIIVTQMGWHNGSGITGTVDVGIYLPDGTRLVSKGSTTQAGASVMQWVDITDTELGPGLFYFAISQSALGTTLHRLNLGAPFGKILGMMQQATAHPLPATATFATTATGGWPLIVASQGSVF